MGRTLNRIGIVVGLMAVAIQFPIATSKALADGYSLPGAVVFYFSFFTILTNILVVLVHTAHAGKAPRLGFFRDPRVTATAVASIVLVGVVYHAVLARLWQPTGLTWTTDVMLHTATPAIMLVWWLVAGRTGALLWTDPVRFLIWPLGYLAYALARAPLAGAVPYPFLDYWTIGWDGVARAIAVTAVVFLVIGFATVLADRVLPPAAGGARA